MPRAKNKPKPASTGARYTTVWLADRVSWVYLVVLGLLPFHAFLTTWAGSNMGHLDSWRIWKELVITATVPAVLYITYQTPSLRKWAVRSWLARLIYLYMGFYIICGIMAYIQGNTNASALEYALFANLRYFGFFLLVVAVSSVSGVLAKYALKVVLGAASVVVGFGALQLFLPYDFLKHFGYGPNTIPAYQTVDNKLAYQRIQSTLRGANPLGAYLVCVAPLAMAWWYKAKRGRSVGACAIAAAVVVLFFSYSRSAYVGFMLSVLIGVFVAVRSNLRRYMAAGLIVLALVGGAGLLMFRHVPVVQNTLFHSDNSSHSVQSSNAGRADALKQGVRDVIHEPFGRGPGTAGPESMRNRYPARIAENYFLQIGQEVGWLGLALFILIIGMIGAELWYARASVLGLALFASLVGLTFVNLVSHAWADDTLGLLWWGLAGLVVGSAIMKSSIHENSSSQKTAKRS